MEKFFLFFQNPYPLKYENFSFYKVSLFHQIGFREFGCVSEIAEIVRQISIFRDNNLARFVFMALESARIDWRLKEKYPGLSKQIDNQRKFELLSRTALVSGPSCQTVSSPFRRYLPTMSVADKSS